MVVGLRYIHVPSMTSESLLFTLEGSSPYILTGSRDYVIDATGHARACSVSTSELAGNGVPPVGAKKMNFTRFALLHYPPTKVCFVPEALAFINDRKKW